MKTNKILYLKGLCYIQDSSDCALALYFNSDKIIKTYCSVSVNNISKNTVTQRTLNYNLIDVIKKSILECKCYGYMDARNISPPSHNNLP